MSIATDVTTAITPLSPVTTDAGESVRVLVSSVSSDSHTWNLIYLQLVLEGLGHEVTNLGACVPEDLLVAECLVHRPALVVLSTVNGHGHQDGLRAIRALRAVPELAATPVVIGGKLGTNGADQVRTEQLLDNGFDAVFDDGPEGVLSFRSFVHALSAESSR